ncbi:uncharacterized protein LOC118425412 [Branchiostoma floridae]|uniref:Uncharacterized protein LOC118425412 n=1 Tax=Branchiostoma floridae TaxID=7739 RepID=A0A9J7LXF1_BRAFL|nr:uncharacterized protein LOC118425412 [Branchiostoma floridae]
MFVSAQWLCGLFDERQNVKNPSVAAGLERTLAAYMNQGLLLVGLGTTLMMFEETRPNLAGWILVPAGAVHIVWSWLEYYFRMRALRNNKEHRAMNYRRSMVWTAVLVALMLLVVGLNMVSNIKYGFVGISLPQNSAEQQAASVTGSP